MRIKKKLSQLLNIVTLLFVAGTSIFAQPRYSVKDLGSLNFSGSSAFGINDSGVVVGQLLTLGSLTNHHAFIYDSTMTDIGTLGGSASAARRINNFGKVVGVSYINSTDWRGFLYDGNSMLPLGTLGGPKSNAYDINDIGTAVGFADIDETYHHAVKYSGLTPIDLGTLLPPGAGYPGWSKAYGINNSGHIVGSSDIGGAIFHAFFYDGAMIDINGPAFESQAWAISDNDYITGDARWVSSGFFFAFIYKDGAMQNIHQMGLGSQGLDVDEDGQVVGWFYNQSYSRRAFLYRDGTMYDLNTLIDSTLGWVLLEARSINEKGQIVGVGLHNGLERAFLLIPPLRITRPSSNLLWIAGEKDTIKWKGGKKNQLLEIDYSVDSGKTFNMVDFVPNGDTGMYVWDIPKEIISKKCMINILDYYEPNIRDTSDVFKIKPYLLTRDSSGQYEPFRPEEDQWGFRNNQSDMWPPVWYQQFDYQGIDPFTNGQYSQWQGNFVFASAISAEHPDWVSFVNAFGVDACYTSTALGLYSPLALAWWDAINNPWRGSCFGIAVSNALAFSYKGQFQTKYGSFPAFANPITVLSDSGVKTVVNELFVHQFGNPHRTFSDDMKMNKTPTETLSDIKNMLKADVAEPRTLSFYKNSGSGGHGIFAYGVERDPIVTDMYYVKVYDNSYPASQGRIWINVAANGGNGSWSYSNFPGWGGNKWMYLMDPAVEYLVNPTMTKQSARQSPFLLDTGELRIFNMITVSIKIKDNAGNVTGFYDDTLQADIPGSIPFIVANGSETPPYGYSLPTDNYSVIVDNVSSDTVKTFFFTGNKTFSYKRYDAEQNQTDRFFFDGGVSVMNPDSQSKTISLLNIINETAQEKLFAFSSVELAENDSVKIENPDSNKIKLISYGTAKDYDIELNYVTGTGIGRFGDSNIPLTANTSHTIVPDWNNVTNTELRILVDQGNDGTIDDTLFLINHVTGIGNDRGSRIPSEYRLEQNYPNPFNPSTTIKYQLPVESKVTLTVYNVLGQVVKVFADEIQTAGYKSIEWDASGIASGVYYCRLLAGNFIETKKLLLLK